MKRILTTAVALSFISSSSVALELDGLSSAHIMEVGEILGFVSSPSATQYGDGPSEENYTDPVLSFVVRLPDYTNDMMNRVIFPGLYYCRVGLERSEDTRWAACYNDVIAD